MRHRMFVVCAVLLGPASTAAQEPTLRVTVGAGRATDFQGIRGDALQIAPSLAWAPRRDLAFSLGGRGTRFVTDQWSLAGTFGAGGRVPLGRRWSASLALAGDATWASYGATYLQAEAIPALEFRAGKLLLWGGARGAAGWRSLTRDPSFLLPADVPGPLERSALGPAFGAALDLADENGNTARLSYREEHGRPAGAAVADRIAAATVTTGAVTLSGTLGLRSEAAGTHAYGGGRIGLSVGPMLSLFAGLEIYPPNLLIDVPAGRAITAGVTFGAGAFRRSGPAPHRVPPPAPGDTRLSIRAPDATRVEVAGDWNQWTPVSLARAANGVWYVDLSIPPGLYRHAFRINGKVWRLPGGVAAVNDGFGGKSAWLSVPKRAPTQ